MNNYSKQREIILEALKNTKIHPTAEEIYNLVTIKHPKISRSTVYRNISILVENNKIRKITTSMGPDRFDYIFENHHHAICERCGKVCDFLYDFEKENFQNIIKEQTGVTGDVDSITFFGICEKCK